MEVGARCETEYIQMQAHYMPSWWWQHGLKAFFFHATQVIGTVTTLHVGIIFCLIGFLFLVSAAIPSQTTSKNEWFNLVATGATCIAIGTFLVCLNRFYGNKEEQELSDYVEAQLGRTTSGHRLVRDQSEINVAAPQAPSPAVAHTSLEQINEDSGRKDKYRVYDKQRRMSSKKQLMQQQPPQELQEQPLQ